MKTYIVTVNFKDRLPMVYNTKDYKEAVKFRAYYNLRKKGHLLKITSVSLQTIN